MEPGQSGNPSGRPRGSRNRQRPIREFERLQAIILAEAYRTVKVNDGNRQVKVPMIQAATRSLAVSAAKGNLRAQRVFTELVASIEERKRCEHSELLESAIIYKTWWERELERRKALGLGGPEPLPHPDDVVVDVQAGTVEFRGPITPEEKEAWDKLGEIKSRCEKKLRVLFKKFKENQEDEENLNELRETLRMKVELEKPASRTDEEWRRRKDGRRLTLVIAPAGLKAIGIDTRGDVFAVCARREPVEANSTQNTAGASATKIPSRASGAGQRDGTKGAAIIALLQRDTGATLAELMQASGWQAHSVRGLLSGTLRKKFGHNIISEKSDDGVRRYRIAA